MDQQNTQNKRQIARWQIEQQALVCPEAGLGLNYACQINDISFKGLKIILREDLRPDTYLTLSVRLSEDFTFTAQAWVVWQKKLGENNIYGLYFSKIKDVDREKIYQFMLRFFPHLIYNKWWNGLAEERFPATKVSEISGPEQEKSSSEGGGGDMEDRRIFSRFSVKFPVKFLSLGENKEGLAQAENISAKGIGLLAQQELKPKTALEMWLQIPDDGEPLYVRGEVVWSAMSQPNGYRAGVNLEKADLEALSRVLRAVS